MKQTLDELLKECEHLHGHICPGQLLGVRMALLGCRLVEIEEPRTVDRKKLIVWVEIDRCVTDAISAVTGARLGRRSLKYLDYGKVAATFLNTATVHAVRIIALDASREIADLRYSELGNRKERQMRAYREASDDELFKVERVSVNYGEMDTPGRPKSRVACEKCLEGINDGREVIIQEHLKVCKSCAFGGYYAKL